MLSLRLSFPSKMRFYYILIIWIYQIKQYKFKETGMRNNNKDPVTNILPMKIS